VPHKRCFVAASFRYNAGKKMIPWLIAGALFVFLLAMNITFVLAARAIKRDMTKRFDEMQRRLESRANSIVDNIFNANGG
jgi:hypothetical protein